MRTTVTLDPDVADALKRAMRERQIGFKEALNDALRASFARPGARRAPYKLKTYDLGAEPLGRWDKALQIAADLEDDEIVRKIQQRK